jgi:hypothetical protein
MTLIRNQAPVPLGYAGMVTVGGVEPTLPRLKAWRLAAGRYRHGDPCRNRTGTSSFGGSCSLSVAGNQGLEPCKAGFGDRPAPRALPMMIDEMIFRLCPGFRWSESNARLRVQSPPACHWPTPEWIPRQALTCNPRLGRPLHFARLGNRAPLRSRTGPSASSAQRSSHESLRGMCGTGMSRCFVSSSVVRERSKVG